MTDVTPQEPNAVQPEGDAAEPQTFGAEYVRELRNEAKQYRLQMKAMQEQLQSFEAQSKQATESKLAEEKRWQELAETKARELDALKTELERERITALRARIAAEANLPQALANRLSGATEDELRADAEALAALIPPVQAVTPTRQTTQLPTGQASTNRDDELRKRFFGSGSN